jgi:hypothetical protein
MYLDPLNQPRGPVTDSQLANMLTFSDYFVWTEGQDGWVVASELLARPGIERLRGEQSRDMNGQPLTQTFNSERRIDRSVQELLGLVRGVTLDGVVSDPEILALDRWLAANAEAGHRWPLNVLSERIGRILADGRIDEEERADLTTILHQVAGGQPEIGEAGVLATRLPVDDPEPTIIFPDRTFVFTGRFVYGTRGQCERCVIERGGIIATGITRKVNYVVIGIHGSRDWIHSTHGRKIEQAVEYRDTGLPLSIISEEHWTGAIRS